MSELAHVPLLLPREDFNFGEREKPQMLRISQAIDIFPQGKKPSRLVTLIGVKLGISTGEAEKIVLQFNSFFSFQAVSKHCPQISPYPPLPAHPQLHEGENYDCSLVGG